jgi:phenylalanine-4-hydroxylase
MTYFSEERSISIKSTPIGPETVARAYWSRGDSGGMAGKKSADVFDFGIVNSKIESLFSTDVCRL